MAGKSALCFDFKITAWFRYVEVVSLFISCLSDKFLEILMTKGKRGFEKFLELLEFSYPHVYRDVLKKEPRDPPRGIGLISYVQKYKNDLRGENERVNSACLLQTSFTSFTAIFYGNIYSNFLW